MKEKKRENLKYCLRYKCKNCPRWKQCEKESRGIYEFRQIYKNEDNSTKH